MPTGYRQAQKFLEALLSNGSREELTRRLEPRAGSAVANGCAKILRSGTTSFESLNRRWDLLQCRNEVRETLADEISFAQMDCYQRNIEHFIGTVKVPLGIAGPLRVNGLFAGGDYLVPLATTEAALVASYSRGAQAITEAGGCSALLLNEGVSRAPGFAFRNLREAGNFVSWAILQLDAFKLVAESTTNHGKLIDMHVTVEGNHVYLRFEFTTGDAAGQNMVTIATEAICHHILNHAPIQPQYHFVEANLSGDKKASVQSFVSVRGKKVTAEIVIPADLLAKRLHTCAEAMTNYWRMSAMGGVLSGTIGVQGHYANGLAALYLACGQDVACVAESAVGVTRFEIVNGTDLYAAVTLPNLIVGTVGGGTGLPSQHACLEILGMAGAGYAQAFAELCAALALAGELSITAALSTGEFARAHRKLARGRKAL
ncbi:MAG: hydroxymethylglutaryl-CoA reductase [Acidobacteria bacterium]|nr:hydroxymethylglutaryl-CoA reductase [Acidobacteriota bacterium]